MKKFQITLCIVFFIGCLSSFAQEKEYYHSHVIGIWVNMKNKQQWSFYSQLGQGAGVLKITTDDWENYGKTQYKTDWSPSLKRAYIDLQETGEQFVVIALTDTTMQLGNMKTQTEVDFKKVSNFPFVGN